MTDQERIYAQIDTAAKGLEPHVIQWRRHIHAHPELSNREVQTAKLIADHLRALNLDEVRTEVGGHGVVGVLRGGRQGPRVVLLRADIDALPVKETAPVEFASRVIDAEYPGGPFPVAHACGHDCHAAMLMGAAQVLVGMRDQLSGTVLFVFQTAEEGAPIGETAGAAAMYAEGAFSDPAPTMTFGMHVSPSPKGLVECHAGVQLAASVLLKIVITGKQTHGSMPWLGIDPMPAAADIISAMGQIYRQVPATDALTVSIGHVEDIGRFNIVGGQVTLWGTVRCLAQPTMDRACPYIARTVEHIAQAYGARATTEFLQPVPALNNRREWVEAALPTLRRVAGEKNVADMTPLLGYDDVSVMVNAFGGLYVMLGVQDTEVVDGQPRAIAGGRGMFVNHNPGFYADDAVLMTGVRLHAQVACDHLDGRLNVAQ